MKITIVGMGNVGTQLAVHCASKGNEVVVYTSRPDDICKDLKIVDENNNTTLTGTITKATNSCEDAFSGAELIIVTMPATMMQENADRIFPFVFKGMKICLAPGTGGGECAFNKCVEKGAILFGVQRVPSVARLIEYGKVTRAVGYRSLMHVAAIPKLATQECCDIIQNILDIPTEAMPTYLNITMTPSNPILHTTRLFNIFGDYKDGVTYESIPLFYEGWNDETSELLFECDAELQNCCSGLSDFDLSYVKSLREHYESPTAHALTEKIQSIEGFKNIGTPSVKVGNRYIPDLNSRYFTADFPYGLAILVQIADFAQIDVPHMKSLLQWYYSLVGNDNSFRFSDYNINSIEDLVHYYSL